MNNKTNYMAKIAINKSLLKEYSNNEYLRIVYMKHGQEKVAILVWAGPNLK